MSPQADVTFRGKELHQIAWGDIQGQGITPDRLLDQPEPLNPGGEGDRWLTDAARVLEAIIDRKTAESLPTADAINSEEMAETA